MRESMQHDHKGAAPALVCDGAPGNRGRGAAPRADSRDVESAERFSALEFAPRLHQDKRT
jgi:hypothetical protein